MEQRSSRIVITILLAGLMVLMLSIAPTPTPVNAQAFTKSWVLKPQLITTSGAQDICNLTGGPPCGTDVYLCYGDASTNGSPTTLTMADKQTTPVTRPNAVVIAANTWYIFPVNVPLRSTEAICAWYPGGLTLTVGNANVLSIQLAGRY